jgi:alanine-glyoxylate transaminase/serine-glyoxylate transaminase/serine-pyruvate transaminase
MEHTITELDFMTPVYGDLNPPTRLLLGPGPGNVDPRVLRAMATPIMSHLDSEFLKIMDETKQLLQYVLQTKNYLTLPVSGTGSAGMYDVRVNVLKDDLSPARGAVAFESDIASLTLSTLRETYWQHTRGAS